LQVPANISLVQLPPYAPELNPIENLWHYLRSHYWANRKYADYTALEAAAMHAWQHTCLNNEIIRSVCQTSTPITKNVNHSIVQHVCVVDACYPFSFTYVLTALKQPFITNHPKQDGYHDRNNY